MSDKALFTGLTVTGTYMGTRIQHSRPDDKGQTKETLYCGIGYFREGRYGQEETVIELTISKALISEGIPAKLHQFQGKPLTLPVFIMPWSNGKGVSYFLANDVKQLFTLQHAKAS